MIVPIIIISEGDFRLVDINIIYIFILGTPLICFFLVGISM